MNKAKTLRRHNGNHQPFLSVAWDTDDTPSQVSIKAAREWQDIDSKRVEKNVFKLQKLIYRASSRGELRKMHKCQKFLTSSYCPRLLAFSHGTQADPGKKTAGVDGIKTITLWTDLTR